MIDTKDILKNKTITDLLKKFGVSDDQVESVVEQAAGSLKSKSEKDPMQMSSLLSKNKNTDKDEVLKKEVEDDFVSGLIKKVGLPEGIADKLKGAMPGIMEQVSSKFMGGDSKDGSGILDTVTGMFDGDDDKSKSGKSKSGGGIMSKITSLFGK